MTKGYVTISIDDGHPTDLRTAEVLWVPAKVNILFTSQTGLGE